MSQKLSTRRLHIQPDQTDPVEAVVVMPVFNDWDAVSRVIHDLSRHLGASDIGRSVVIIVDDGSTVPSQLEFGKDVVNLSIFLVALHENVGHQRAIAVGLAYVGKWIKPEQRVVVMDADGEDRPCDVVRLIQESRKNDQSIVVAHRSKRSEGALFRAGYFFYKTFFRLLTGNSIRHGNFSVLRGSHLLRLIYQPTLWNHYAATINSARFPVIGVDLLRGERYSGRSSMSLTQLIAHGLSAITVNIETVGVRLLIFSLMLTMAALIGGAVVIGIRLFTVLAIPGWASILSVLFFIVALLGLLMSLQLIFQILSMRGQRAAVPALETSGFVSSVRRVS